MIKTKLAPILLKLYKPDVFKYLQQTKKLYVNRENVYNYQLFRLQKLLFHAYHNTIYYRRVFDEIGLIQEDKINWKKFNLIPLLTKEIIRENYDQICSNDNQNRKIYKNTSCGPTGEPVVYIQDSDYYNRMVADTLYFGEIYDKTVGEQEIKLWGSEKDIFNERKSFSGKFKNYFFNRILLNSFKLNHHLIENYIEVINTVRPKMIWTYVDSIFEIAKYINRNPNLKVFQPHVIVCTAGTMYSELKEEIKAAFPESIIANQYGSREVGIIGIGTEDIDIFSHSVYLELYNKTAKKFIRNAGIGNVIITQLNNYAMPLIKFDIGDIGESHTIDGTAVRSLSGLNGRENAHIIRRDGNIIHGELFTHLFYFMRSVKKFQLIQEDYQKFTINLETIKSEVNDNNLDKVKDKINYIMGVPCEIKFNIIESLPKLKSGKYQFVFSKVKNDKT
ncbi:MAG: hypothetical protein ACLFQM_05780 [Fidelibacterota bacterium]